MKIFIPTWIKHSTEKSNTPVYSVHVHPTEDKLATGGQDFTIKIWNTKPVMNEKDQLDDQVQQLLSTLNLHDGAVLCVRWSPDGVYLASGSDDTKIVVWTLDKSNLRNTSFGSKTKNVETYRPVRVLMGHESDIADLAWSHDQQYLASCGFDSKIYIWDGSTFDRITRIDSHLAFVKGVTWDPAGKYIATQSDDKTVRIFRTTDWRMEKEISAPYDCASTTFFRRLSWSPDGGTIASVNGESGGVCVAPMIYRDDWQPSVCLVGHEAPVEVALFNPHLFVHNNEKTGLPKETAVCALGSQDNGISVWWTGSSRAISSTQQLFTHSVLDLAWTPNGLGLFSCSYDGTVAFMDFDPDDFGSKVSEVDKVRSLSKYGASRERNIIPESNDIIVLEKQMQQTTDEMLLERINDSHFDTQIGFSKASQPPVAEAAPLKVNTITFSNQDITVTKDGKKRIRPTLLQTTAPSTSAAVTKVTPSNAFQPNLTEPREKRQKNSSVDDPIPIKVEYILPIVQSVAEHSNLSVPAVRSVFTTELKHGESKLISVLEFKNSGNGCQLICSQGESQIWTNSYKAAALLATTSMKYVAIAYADATLHLFTLAGRRILPPLKMQSAPSFLQAKNEYLLYIDCLGNVSTWDIIKQNCILELKSITPLLSPSITITSVSIHDDGMPLVSTSDNQTYKYSNGMKCWQQLSHLQPSLLELNKGFPKTEQIELSLATAMAMKDTKNIIYWLKLYCRKLCDESSIKKVKELCGDLNGGETVCWPDDDADVPKSELFKEVLPILIKNRSFQRFLSNDLQNIL
ncbi:WD40-repeat-containing domain protein [Globomyces pollinis-pini]|nr:WD40-repeat-containing domain protein [Globomyces pollinis-pini]